jgi:hypothetical protein
MISELQAEITRLQDAKRRALQIADERAEEANRLRANLQEAWAALTMIRETVETLAPSGAVKAAEHLDGPTFMHEAEALVAGIVALAGQSPAASDARRPQDWVVQALSGWFAEHGDQIPDVAKGDLAAQLALACAGIQGDVETEPFYRTLSARATR